tara:strand:+ start:1082 stop:1597 length:516 start_codon:yes stop_codon:yes gene_type:complete
MALNTTATLSSDIVFQQLDTESTSLDNRQGSLTYSQSLTSGTGSTNVNSVYSSFSHSIGAGSGVSLDFTSLSQSIVGGSMSVSMSNLKSIVVHNSSSTTGEDILVRATGSNALTEVFNGGSGNLSVKPSATYMYSDPYTGATVNSSNKNFQIVNDGTGSISIDIIAVGVSG